jgi:rhomboid protease GluP
VAFVEEEQPNAQWCIIPTKHRNQAMDWSLVLTSQKIATEILAFPEGKAPYGLKVQHSDLVRAQDAIRRFQHENVSSPWHKQLPASGFSFNWACLLWCLVLCIFAWMGWTARPEIQLAGIMKSREVIEGNAWWQTVTAVMLHADIGHLASNVSSGFLLLGLAMGRFGAGPALLAAFLCGVWGNFFGLWIHETPYRGLGASGMMMGALGMLGPHSIQLLKKHPQAGRIIVGGILAVTMLFSLWGLSPTSDVAAHLGGFISGLGMGALLGLIPEKQLQAWRLNMLCSLLLTFLLVWAWRMALTGGRPFDWRAIGW